MNFEDLSGYDKAALIFDILGDSLALHMFKDIPESEIFELRVHAKKLKNVVPTQIKKEVLEDYYFKLLSNENYRNQKSSNKLFDFLEELNDEQLFALLSDEKPRVIALALEQVPDENKQKFINKISPDLKNKIIMETGNLHDIPLEAVVNTSRELAKNATFLPAPKEFSRGGGKSVANMLNNMSEDESKQFLEQLKADNMDLFNDVKKYFLSFEDIIAMPEAMAADFWMNPDIDLEVMAKALKGLGDDIVEKTRGYLPGKKQDMFEPVEGAISKSEIEDARSTIKDMVQKNIDEGAIKIEDILGGGDVVE
tara:strand:+ start:482 stop:1411 length:930 start_codon:yes stop_codon:yes gene_type:complete